jgi:thioredoxin-like negative regulator of GroEL
MDPDDWAALAVQAQVLAHRGDDAAAEELARAAVARGEETDMLTWQGDAHWGMAEVLLAAGKAEAADDAFGQALKRYERKKNLALAAQLRARRKEVSAST